MTQELQRVCVKIHAAEHRGIADEVFVPIFHEWIRDRSLPLVLIDVADYTHVPDGPGVMLISHSASFALERSDGRFGLYAQRRRPARGNAADAIAETWRDALNVAAYLEKDARVRGMLTFDRENVRIESNDRLRAPNSEPAFAALEPFVRAAVDAVCPGRKSTVARVVNDPRERLALEVRIAPSTPESPRHGEALIQQSAIENLR